MIVGGYDDEQQWIRDVWCYNPQTDTWQTLASFPGRNRRFGCIALGNDIYIIGGQADHGDHMSETLSDVWRYDSITNTWSQVRHYRGRQSTHEMAAQFIVALINALTRDCRIAWCVAFCA